MLKDTFLNCKKIEFTEGSELCLIDACSFEYSAIKSISVPKKKRLYQL